MIGIAADDVLWVRDEPRRDASEAGSMPPDATGIDVGRCIDVAGYSFKWCEVSYRCVKGWAYARYLDEAASAEAPRAKPTVCSAS